MASDPSFSAFKPLRSASIDEASRIIQAVARPEGDVPEPFHKAVAGAVAVLRSEAGISRWTEPLSPENQALTRAVARALQDGTSIDGDEAPDTRRTMTAIVADVLVQRGFQEETPSIASGEQDREVVGTRGRNAEPVIEGRFNELPEPAQKRIAQMRESGSNLSEDMRTSIRLISTQLDANRVNPDHRSMIDNDLADFREYGLSLYGTIAMKHVERVHELANGARPTDAREIGVAAHIRFHDGATNPNMVNARAQLLADPQERIGGPGQAARRIEVHRIDLDEKEAVGRPWPLALRPEEEQIALYQKMMDPGALPLAVTAAFGLDTAWMKEDEHRKSIHGVLLVQDQQLWIAPLNPDIDRSQGAELSGIPRRIEGILDAHSPRQLDDLINEIKSKPQVGEFTIRNDVPHRAEGIAQLASSRGTIDASSAQVQAGGAAVEILSRGAGADYHQFYSEKWRNDYGRPTMFQRDDQGAFIPKTFTESDIALARAEYGKEMDYVLRNSDPSGTNRNVQAASEIVARGRPLDPKAEAAAYLAKTAEVQREFSKMQHETLSR